MIFKNFGLQFCHLLLGFKFPFGPHFYSSNVHEYALWTDIKCLVNIHASIDASTFSCVVHSNYCCPLLNSDGDGWVNSVLFHLYLSIIAIHVYKTYEAVVIPKIWNKIFHSWLRFLLKFSKMVKFFVLKRNLLG
jgi:hypothetical protein